MTDPGRASKALVLYQRRTEDLSKALVVRRSRGDSPVDMSDLAVASESVTSDLASPPQGPAGASRRHSGWKGKKPAKPVPVAGPSGPSSAPNGQRNGYGSFTYPHETHAHSVWQLIAEPHNGSILRHERPLTQAAIDGTRVLTT
jgi:hypothetical protein